jgi:fermentation-respiration switch protein FrsA (DUF1100 family)
VLFGFIFLTTLLCLLLEDKFIYQPTRFGPYDEDPGFPREYRTFSTSDGLVLHGCLSKVENSRGVILWMHGSGGNVTHCMRGISDLRAFGLDVFVFDYRGYGRSEGSPSEEGLYLDARAAYRHLTDTLRSSPDRIVLFGKSLGTVPAVHLASQVKCAGLVFQSGFTSARDMAAVRLPLFPWVWPLTRSRFDSLGTIPRVSCPKLFIHSRDDEAIPFWMAEKLFSASSEPRELFAVSGYGHEDGLLRQTDAYRQTLSAFLDRVLPK